MILLDGMKYYDLATSILILDGCLEKNIRSYRILLGNI